MHGTTFFGGGFYSMEEVYVAVMFVECMDEIKLSALNHLTAFPSMPALFHSLLRKTAWSAVSNTEVKSCYLSID